MNETFKSRQSGKPTVPPTRQIDEYLSSNGDLSAAELVRIVDSSIGGDGFLS
jgi:hypothetical protein